jgi:hypothetical protein
LPVPAIQEVEGELLLLGSRPQPPCLDRPDEGDETVVAAAHQDRLAAGPQRGELVGLESVAGLGVEPDQVGDVDPTVVGEQPVDQVRADLGRDPSGRPAVVAVAAAALVLDGVEPDLGGFDAQGGVVRHHDGRAMGALAEGGSQDAVVGLGRVEALGRHLVEHQPVGLDAQRAASGQLDGMADVATVGDPQLLYPADDLPRRSAHVVDPGLVLIELLDDDEWDHGVGVREGEQRLGVGYEHRGVEHDPGRRGGEGGSG